MMSTLRRVRLGALLCVAALLLVGALPAFAQSDTARLQGVVTDSTGALVPDATVKVTNAGTNQFQQANTDAGTGAYSFPALPPGNYSLEISKTGFKTIKQNVTLEVAQVANVNFTVEPGAVSQEVDVTEQAALVDSATSDLGLTVQTKQIEDLPLNGRNFTELATLVPGVTRGVPGNTATGEGNNAETFRYSDSGGAALDVNGARPQANNFMLDGVDNNESLVNTIVFFPPADAIQEFRVQTNMASAEYGRAGGAMVNTAIKSGTNQFHGAAFDYLRNSQLDARPTFAETRNPFRRNQFGADIGGPIRKNKIFIFGDYQGLRQSEPIENYRASVPTALMRQGNFSELLNPAVSLLPSAIVITNLMTGQPFPGNIIPSNLQNPVGLKYLNAYPQPNLPGVEQNYALQRQQVQNLDDFDIRGDWDPTERDQIFLRTSNAHDPEVTDSRFPALPAGFGSGTQFTYAHAGAVGYTHTFSPTVLSDLRMEYQRTFLGYTPPFDSEPLSANLGIPNANTSPLLGGGALIGGYNSQIEYTGDYGPYLVPENTYQIAETLSWIKGNHSFKFGANIIRREVNLFRPIAGKGFFNLYGNGQGGPGATGYEVSDLLAGFVNAYDIGPPYGMVGTRTWENGFFAQDDFRVSRRLTLNLGLRWDYLSAPTEVDGRQSNFNLATGAIDVASGGGDALVKNNWNNWGPRFGFAYDVFGNGKTAIRGGYGIFYFLDRGGISNQLAQNPPFSGESTYTYQNGYRITLSGACPVQSGIPNWMTCTGALPQGNFNGLSLSAPQNVSVLADLPNNKTSSMQQWNFQIQQELPSSMVASVAYVGTAGHHLIDYLSFNNPFFNSPYTQLYPGMGSVTVEDAGGNSNYNALQLELSKRLAKGLQFTASYTWSKTIDDGTGAFGNAGAQNFLDLEAERGPSDQDIPQRFVFSAVYELPFGRGKHWGSDVNRAADAVFGGWQINGIWTAQSGLPFSIGQPSGSPGGRVNLVGPVTINPGNTQQYICCQTSFAAVPLNSSGVMIAPGNLGRNVFYGPGIDSVDLSLFKVFALTERMKLDFRAEAFNIANHPQFAQPNLGLGQANFGVINNTLYESEREIQFGAKLSF